MFGRAGIRSRLLWRRDREVAVLVNEQKLRGTYEVRFNGSKFASGTYVYRLTAGSTVLSRKMALVR